MSTTVYDINTRYSLEDRTSGKLQQMGAAADGAWRQLEKLGGLLAGGLFLHQAQQSLIGFNSEMQNLEISSSAKLFGFGLATNIGDARLQARGLVDEFKRFEATAPVTMQDIAQFSGGIDAAVVGAGGGLRDITTVAERGVIAAKALGANAEYAALELTEGIQRGVNTRMRFLKQLLAFGGVEEEAFKGATQGDRLRMLEKIFESPAITQAAKDFGDSWDGVTSTLKSKVQQALGAIGLPLFQSMTREIASWNDWAEKNKTALEEMGQKASQYLITGFHEMKDAVAFVIDNKDTLLAIAEVWAAGKAISLVGDVGAGAAALLGRGAGLAGQAAALGAPLLGARGMAMDLSLLGPAAEGAAVETTGLALAGESAAAGLTGLLGPIGLVAGGLGALYLGMRAADAMPGGHDDRARQLRDIEGTVGNLNPNSDQAQVTGAVFDWAKTHGALVTTGENQGLDRKALMDQLIALGESDGARVTKVADMAERIINAMSPEDWNKRLGIATYGPPLEGAGRAKKQESPTTIHIHKMEIASPDPDRFAMGLKGLAAKLNRNRSVAQTAYPTGG